MPAAIINTINGCGRRAGAGCGGWH